MTIAAANILIPTWRSVTFSQALTSGTTYWIRLSSTGSNNAAYWQWWAGTAAGSLPSGKAMFSSDFGSTWSNGINSLNLGTDWDFSLKTYKTGTAGHTVDIQTTYTKRYL